MYFERYRNPVDLIFQHSIRRGRLCPRLVYPVGIISRSYMRVSYLGISCIKAELTNECVVDNDVSYVMNLLFGLWPLFTRDYSS
jgi:hypothetical protein